jgi:hypothetical protein
VKADWAKDRAAAAAAKATAEAHQKLMKDRVAALEDAKQIEENARSLEELRLDLYTKNKSASNFEVETLSDSHLRLNEPSKLPCEPLIKPPLEYSPYRESSHSEEFLTSWQEEEDENNVVVADEYEANQDQDQDYVTWTDDKSEASEASQALQERHEAAPPPKPKAKFKPQHKVQFSVLLVINVF